MSTLNNFAKPVSKITITLSNIWWVTSINCQEYATVCSCYALKRIHIDVVCVQFDAGKEVCKLILPTNLANDFLLSGYIVSETKSSVCSFIRSIHYVYNIYIYDNFNLQRTCLKSYWNLRDKIQPNQHH